MKQRLIAFFAATFFLVACGGNDKKEEGSKEAPSADKTTTTEIPPAPTDSAGMAAMMKAWQDFATPGPEHAWMAESAGTWF